MHYGGMLRLSVGLAGALTLTFLQFSVMYVLVGAVEFVLDEKPAVRIADIIMPDARIREFLQDDRPERPDEPEEPPPELPPLEQEDFDLSDEQLSMQVSRPDISLSTGLGLSSEGEYIPLVKVAPIYPSLPQRRGIEGHCLVEYTVTRTGAVKDPKAVDCQPSGMFERASVRAALKFKYKPRVIDGQTVEVTGVQNLFSYKLEE